MAFEGVGAGRVDSRLDRADIFNARALMTLDSCSVKNIWGFLGRHLMLAYKDKLQ